MLIIISGPSGVGKTPIIYSILDSFDVVKRIQSYTTRNERKKEVSGTYIYMTPAQFEQKIKEGFFLEYNRVHKDQHYYGTGFKSYKDIVDQGYVAIKDIDVDSYKSIKSKGLDTVGIYLAVKNRQVLFDRLRERGESQKTINMRLYDRVDYENAQQAHFDYVIYTDNFEKAKKQAVKIVEKELKKRKIKYKKLKTKTYEEMF